MLLRLSLVLLLPLFQISLAHNWLTRPHAFNTRFPTRSCKGSECTNACPPIMLPHEMHNTVNRPAAHWRRGQNVQVSWARNNHHGGMFRMSLVPVPSMNNRKIHKKFTIMHGCFESGLYNCRKARHPCGTDNSQAYRRRFTIPTVFHDGDYVLGYVWYGGLHFTKKKGQFPDFYSCAFVRIQGGKRVGGRYTPRWSPGFGKNIRHGKCLSATGSVGVCGRYGCSSRKAFWTKSREFLKRNPPSFGPSDVKKAFSVKNGDNSLVSGLCKSNVCCLKSCGGCGGKNCHKKKGESRGCCIGTITRSRKSCKNNPPPCVIDP